MFTDKFLISVGAFFIVIAIALGVNQSMLYRDIAQSEQQADQALSLSGRALSTVNKTVTPTPVLTATPSASPVVKTLKVIATPTSAVK